MALRKNVCVAISTFGERLENALEVAKNFKALGVDVMVIHQLPNAESLCKYVVNDIQIHELNSVGVTKSRNYAIDNACNDFLWFMDDDVVVVADQVEKTISKLTNSHVGFFVCEVCDEKHQKRKKYLVEGAAYNRMRVLNIGTIEVIVNLKEVRKAGVRFPEFMGAGTSLPVSDEAVFLARLISRNIQGVHVGTTPLIHPAESSGTIFTESFFLSKALMFKLIFGSLVGFVLFLAFVVKNNKKSESNSLLRLTKKAASVFLKRGYGES